MTNDHDNIPTLTNIVQVGDESMHHHFDEGPLVKNEDRVDTEYTLENASEPENQQVEDIPSVQLDKEDISEELSEALQLNIVASEQTPETDEIKQHIDNAIADILPDIEDRLKQQLYKQFDIQ